MTQAELARLTNLSQSTVSRVELGRAEGLPLRSWLRLAGALELPARFELGRDPLASPADAGHLEVQEMLLRRGERLGYEVASEVTPPATTLSVDVQWVNRARRLSVILEAWNVVGDIGAGARSFRRKLAAVAAAELALDSHLHVRGCWVVRVNERNRRLLARYPAVFASLLPGSSRAWVRALEQGSDPPLEPGLVLCDPRRDALFEWRR